MKKTLLLLLALCGCVHAQFETPVHTLTVLPRGTGAGETGVVCFRELAANGVDALCFQADDDMAAPIAYVLPNADAAGPLCSDGAGVLTWGTCASSGVGNLDEVILSDGSGGFKTDAGFVFDTSGPDLTVTGDLNFGLHQNLQISAVDSGFFERRFIWLDGSDGFHIGLENANNTGSRIVLHTLNNSVQLPDMIPPRADGNNYWKFSSGGVGDWSYVAAEEIADDTVLETPRGVLNFGPTITVTDELARLTAAVNMAATYIWTGGQNFDTNVNAVVTGSPTRDITNFDRVEAWGTFNGPNMEWRTNPATTGVNPYWRATAASSGNDLAWTRSGAVLAYWTGSYFGFDGDVRPITAGSFGLGNAGAPWGTAQIETATFGSSLQNGSARWTNTVGNTHEFFIGGSGNANLYWLPPLTDTNYGLFFQEPTSASANLLGLYTETVSGSNQRGVVSVYDESIASAAYLRPTSLQLSATQVVTTRQAAVADATGTAGATYTATEQAMLNGLKAQLNALLARLRTHGLIAP